MNIVITGSNGFVGKHLTEELISAGHQVIGIGMDPAADSAIADKLVEYASCNLVEEWPEIKTPVDAIIHLAGLAAVGPSFDKPQDYIHFNSAMLTNMCEHYVKQDTRPRIVIVSSGAIYDPSQPMPISESSPVAFGSPYAISKVLNENQAAYYNSRGIQCVVMRPFNHIGPGQMPGFIVPDLLKKIRERTSVSDPITAGNLTSRRDYTDVRDVAKAYRLVATSPDAPKQLVYNVCSGVSFSGEDVLEATAKALDMPTPEVTVDENLLRPNDIADIRGDSTRLVSEFGWEPTYAFEQSINDFVKSN